MAKQRVYEIAKEIGVPSKEVIFELERMGFLDKKHSSGLDDVTARTVVTRVKKRMEEIEAKIQTRILEELGEIGEVQSVGGGEDSTFGILFSIYLTFLEPFVIGATCAWCVTSAILMTVLFVLTLRDGKYGCQQLTLHT